MVKKSHLAHYGTFISLFLTLSTLASGLTISTLLTFLLLMPLPLYFFLQSLKFYRKSRLIPHYPVTLLPSYSFSLSQFLTQPNLSFRLSLLLLFLALFTTFARIHSDPPTLSYHLESGI